MTTPRSWITEFVDLKGITDDRFARDMTFAGNKVESVRKVGGESVYEFEITSNRPDTLSVIGLAREASAVFNRKLKPPLPVSPERSLSKHPIRLSVSDKKLCPVYSIVEIDNVTVKSSSALIQKRLTLADIRPVNNVVDVTNYVMLETGQPMHAFDADRIEGVLTLRAAKKRETIVPLDHKERVLTGGEIIIEDQEKLVDLAGLMGGLNTEISELTTHVLLLIPIYDPVAIRRASKFLRLRTEASTRFEKKIDLTQTETVTRRALTLLAKETGGKQSTRIVTKEGSDLSGRSDPLKPVTLTPVFVSKLVGIPLSEPEITRLLKKVGIEKTTRGYRPPSWRRDIVEDVDLVEEVTRLYGFNKLPRTLPTGEIPVHSDALATNWRRRIAELVASIGYTETYGSTLTSKTEIEWLGLSPDEHLRVLHPMSEDYEYLRRSMITTLVPFLKQNLVHQQEVRLFELGTVFHATHDDELPDQPLALGMIATTSFERMKGDIEKILQSIGLNAAWEEEPSPSTSFVRSLSLSHAETTIGSLVHLHPDLFDGRAKGDVWASTLNCSLLLQRANLATRYPRMSDFPPIIEDVTLVRPPTGGYVTEVIKILKDASPLVINVEYIGTFNDAVTMRLTFQSFERNLIQNEVNGIKNEALTKLNSMGWKLKS